MKRTKETDQRRDHVESDDVYVLNKRQALSELVVSKLIVPIALHTSSSKVVYKRPSSINASIAPLSNPSRFISQPRPSVHTAHWKETLDSHDLLLRLIRPQVLSDDPNMDSVLPNSVFLDSFQDGSVERGLVGPSVVVAVLCVIVTSG
jgi:hypothetical protein